MEKKEEQIIDFNEYGKIHFVYKGSNVAGKRSKLEFTSIIGEKGLPKGSSLKILIFGRNKWPMLQSDDPAKEMCKYNPDKENYVLENNIIYESKFPVNEGFFENNEYPSCFVDVKIKKNILYQTIISNRMQVREVEVKILEDLYCGDIIKITFFNKIKGEVGLKLPIAAQDIQFNAQLCFVKDQKNYKFLRKIIFKILPDTPFKYKIICPSIVKVNEKFKFCITFFDKFGNPIRMEKIQGIKFLNEDISIKSKKIYKYSFIFEASLKKEGIYRLTIANNFLNSILVSECNPIFCTNNKRSNLYWADLHGHSYLSDGMESPDFYYDYAKNVEHLDCSALTDHCSMLTRQGRLCWKEPLIPYSFWKNNISAWPKIKNLTDKYNEPGSFVTLLGLEWDGSAKFQEDDGKYGDRNIYFLNEIEDDFLCKTSTRFNTPEKLCNFIKNTDAFIIPHHTSYPEPEEDTYFSWGADLSYIDNNKQFLIEVYSKHGSSEYKDCEFPLVKTGSKNFVVNCLKMGHKFGFVGGSDTHASRPGSNFREEFTPVLKYAKSGLTAIFSDNLSRSSVFNSLKRKMCYATSGERIILFFNINSKGIGDELKVQKGEKLEIKIEAYGTEKIEEVSLIKNGDCVFLDKPNKLDYIKKINAQVMENSFYYLKVKQVNGSLAWSSPIWVEVS
ncbi:MAG: DUF3604 domain-containing protein [Actinobacteria bacterium]|nr:DUF3604 domain-containing protein [Actinomycetota bacterium]